MIGNIPNRSIAKLRLKTCSRNQLIRLVRKIDGSGDQVLRRCRKAAPTVKVSEIMSAIEAMPLWDAHGYATKDTRAISLFKAELVRLRMTEQDWFYLAKSREQIGNLILQRAAARSRSEVKKHNVCLLIGSSLSTKIVERLEHCFGKKVLSITIGELIEKTPLAWSKVSVPRIPNQDACERPPFSRTDLYKTVARIRKKLYALGFVFQDGLLFQVGTMRYEVAELASAMGVTTNLARQIVDYAQLYWGAPIVSSK